MNITAVSAEEIRKMAGKEGLVLRGCGGGLKEWVDGVNGEKAAVKPDCNMAGQDGNVFNLAGIASRTLRKHGQGEKVKEMTDRIFSSDSYSEALSIIGEYVNIVFES